MEERGPEAPKQLGHYLRERPYSVAVGLAMIIAGMVFGPLVFPDLSVIRAVLGGALFGAFCAVCAVTWRLL